MGTERGTELPVATRHRRDMTEKLLQATLNPNKQQHNYNRDKSISHVPNTPEMQVCVGRGAVGWEWGT